MIDRLNERLPENNLDEGARLTLAAMINDKNRDFVFSNQKLASNPRLFKQMPKEEQTQFITELKQRDELILTEISMHLNEEQLNEFKKQQQRKLKSQFGQYYQKRKNKK